MTQTRSRAEKRSALKVFGPVWDGAGARGFSGEGYWYHKFVPGLSFEGSTFAAKSITTFGTQGNMPLTEDFTPRKLFPNCIVVDLRNGYVLNAVGLSGPSVAGFFATKRWQQIPQPFFMSYMPVLSETDARYRTETEQFVYAFYSRLNQFSSQHIALQFNVSCANVGVDLEVLLRKARRELDMLAVLGIPIVLKINALTPVELAVEIAQHPACYGICVSNSIPFGTLLPKEWWEKHFPNGSPLTARGFSAGGLSGAPLLPYVADWIRRFREIDRETYLNAGGGITHKRDVNTLYDAGADSISVASVALVRPWRLPSIIRCGHTVFR